MINFLSLIYCCVSPSPCEKSLRDYDGLRCYEGRGHKHEVLRRRFACKSKTEGAYANAKRFDVDLLANLMRERRRWSKLTSLSTPPSRKVLLDHPPTLCSRLPPRCVLASPARGGGEKTACGLRDGGVDKEVSLLHRRLSSSDFASVTFRSATFPAGEGDMLLPYPTSHQRATRLTPRCVLASINSKNFSKRELSRIRD